MLFVFGAGLFAKFALGCPWIVEAVNVDHPSRSDRFEIKGWRASRDAVDRLSTEIASTGLPDSFRTPEAN